MPDFLRAADSWLVRAGMRSMNGEGALQAARAEAQHDKVQGCGSIDLCKRMHAEVADASGG